MDTLELARQVLDEAFPGAVLGLDGVPPEGALIIDRDRLVETAGVLKTDPRLAFKIPLFCTAVDWLEREPRYDIVYQVRSLELQATLRFKVAAGEPPSVPTVSGVWRGMGWHEREAYDMFGVTFEGHPDLRRLLMPDDWEGHPLRKDYISFGEPVKFTDRDSFQPDAAVSQGAPD